MRTFKVIVIFGFEFPRSQVGVVKLLIPNLVRILVRFFICWDGYVESPPIIRFYGFFFIYFENDFMVFFFFFENENDFMVCWPSNF